MKRKILSSVIVVICILFYTLSFIATKKVMPTDPCYDRTTFWMYQDSARSRHAYLLNTYTDTILLRIDTIYASRANAICDTICSIYKDSCNRTGVRILVVNSNDTARSTWETRWGKTIFFRTCP